MGRKTNRSKIIALLYDQRDGMSNAAIQAKLKLSEKTYARERERLLLEGLVQKKGQGGGLRLTDSFLEEFDKAMGIETQDSSTGSAFFISSAGHLLTNAHVVEGADRVVVVFNGQSYISEVKAKDTETDLALLKIEHRPAKWATFRDAVRLGEDVGAFGFPLNGLLTKTGNFSRGSVTGVAGLFDEVSQFQIQAPIQSGNSGGPVADVAGNVVGVVVSSVKRRNYSIDVMPENTNFAIRAETAIAFARQHGVNVASVSRVPSGRDWSPVAHRLVDMTALIYSDEGYGEVPDDLHPPGSSVARMQALGAGTGRIFGRLFAWTVSALALVTITAGVVWARGLWPL
jgi:S1-C subfamily serine protease